MNSARNKLKATTEHIKTLRVVLGIFFCVIVMLWIRNGSLQETRRLYIPPDLTQGAIVQFDQVPPPVVYTFASYIFQQLNRWQNDGEDDYQAQIFKLQGYLTPSCITFLTEDRQAKSQLGELRSRVRMIEELTKEGYSRQRIHIETPQSWIVWLDFQIRESISGHPVKNVYVRYRLRIVKFDVDKEVNPWGLAIACDDTTKPVLLTEQMVQQPFRRQENFK